MISFGVSELSTVMYFDDLAVITLYIIIFLWLEMIGKA